jgi:hypothetical protein
MRKLILTIALVGFIPMSGLAQESKPVPQPPPSAREIVNSVDMARLLVIGAGIVAGAVVLEAIAIGDLSVLAGAVVGGLAADWWYNREQEGVMLKENRFQRSARTAARPRLLRIAATTSRH